MEAPGIHHLGSMSFRVPGACAPRRRAQPVVMLVGPLRTGAPGASGVWGPRQEPGQSFFGFFLCSHQFSTWTHPSSSQVSCDLAKMSFPCLSAVSVLSYCPGGELWMGAEGTAFILVLTCLQGWREERVVQSAVILEGWSLHPGAFWVGVRMLRNTNICLPRKG